VAVTLVAVFGSTPLSKSIVTGMFFSKYELDVAAFQPPVAHDKVPHYAIRKLV
jgi:hypothetical protein